ncbi:LysM peptidoglycan-binding domain-containing protein [Anaerosphaera multitolerans]|uniref:LysM peptidoglycan-binding domain-containing protein n=1 Tax=Anaerosphaera multitolerans TaxID=2487351 RepID=A0A437S534_9FIRM|nr:LysM peptidoglycan-binding domain-containing protein [Anaerosphaera multitolerans]RVU54152.1 LysM peptidoglycan-binding domain-containing protein [Anaerosphaera multitolerans]
MKKKIYLKKTRIIIFLLITFIFSTGINTVDSFDYNVSNFNANNSNLDVEDSYINYIVKENDTIWSIVNENIDIKRDKREYVSNIIELNNIKGNIYPGDVLLIPSY